jgi:hypothetical protein
MKKNPEESVLLSLEEGKQMNDTYLQGNDPGQNLKHQAEPFTRLSKTGEE